MKTFLYFLKFVVGMLFIISAVAIECMCQLTYVRNPSDLNMPRIVALILFILGLVLTK